MPRSPGILGMLSHQPLYHYLQKAPSPVAVKELSVTACPPFMLLAPRDLWGRSLGWD